MEWEEIQTTSYLDEAHTAVLHRYKQWFSGPYQITEWFGDFIAYLPTTGEQTRRPWKSLATLDAAKRYATDHQEERGLTRQ
jgi:hypothetical protein